jgi:hypothetical protein
MMLDKVPADTQLSTLLYLCASEPTLRGSIFKDKRFSDGTKKYAFNEIVPAGKTLEFVVSGICGVLYEFPADLGCVGEVRMSAKHSAGWRAIWLHCLQLCKCYGDIQLRKTHLVVATSCWFSNANDGAGQTARMRAGWR